MKIKKIKKLVNKILSSRSSRSISPSYSFSLSPSCSCSPSMAPGEIEPKYVKKTIRCSNCKKVLTRCNILITKEYYSYDSEDSPRTLPEVIEEEEVLCDMCYKLMKLKE